MQSATILQAGLATHPNSGRRCLRIMVSQPYASGGVRCSSTDIWCDPCAPEPASGDPVEWDAHHVKVGGHVWPKLEYDSPSYPVG